VEKNVYYYLHVPAIVVSILSIFLLQRIIHKFTAVHVRFHALHARTTLLHVKAVPKATSIFLISTSVPQVVLLLITRYQTPLVFFATQVVISAVSQVIIALLALLACIYSQLAIYA
jgi:hypothetical protein